MIDQSDEIIMTEVRQGDLDKSALLFERYQTKVYNYFLNTCFNEQLSMDLAQNTFYRMLHYRNSYKTELSFKSWLFGIARNVFLDNVKSKHSKTDSLEKLNYEKHSDKNEVISKFENEALYRALNRLSDEDRDLIVMSRFQNIKYKEIAEIHGLSLAAVKVKVHRAIKKLREFYFKDDITINIKSN